MTDDEQNKILYNDASFALLGQESLKEVFYFIPHLLRQYKTR
jgi:hypothetical protein